MPRDDAMYSGLTFLPFPICSPTRFMNFAKSARLPKTAASCLLTAHPSRGWGLNNLLCYLCSDVCNGRSLVHAIADSLPDKKANFFQTDQKELDRLAD